LKQSNLELNSLRVRRPAFWVAVALLPLVAAMGCTPAEGESRSATSDDAATPSTPTPPAGHAWVIFGTDTVVAEVAASPEERAEGLMYRDELADGTGMLFVFEQPAIQSFWMANTYIPLDIAYMDASYRITDILQMEPLDTGSYPSTSPALFALEVNEGWFAEKGIEAGAQADIVFGVQGHR
jgi:uncharacterized membrane protein (UPF0127 family)